MCDIIACDRMCSVVCEVRETPGIGEDQVMTIGLALTMICV